MRPIGHDAAREERDDAIAPAYEEILATWDTYLQTRPDHYGRKLELARRLFEPLYPTVGGLHRLIVGMYPLCAENSIDRNDLGIFVSAGYGRVPDREIVYDLTTPLLSSIGYCIEKDFTNKGELGDFICFGMIGTLRNDGAFGDRPGQEMIGTFINNGASTKPGERMIGVYQGSSAYISFGENNGRWTIRERERQSFLHAITNPEHLPYETLYSQLSNHYRQWRRIRKG